MNIEKRRSRVKEILIENKSLENAGKPYEFLRFDMWIEGIGTYIEIDDIIESVIKEIEGGEE